LTGEARESSDAVSWTQVFSQEMVTLADRNDKIVGITAAMLRPTGLHQMAAKYPDRVLDVGIAEQHAVASAAGLAYGGMHPVVAVYATFINRAFDQVLMDVALHNAGVTFVLDRAGVTGPDGPSHHGMWDLSILQVVPRIRIAAPRDAKRLREELGEAVAIDNAPTVVRFPKGSVSPEIEAVRRTADGVDVMAEAAHKDVLLVAVGPMVHMAMDDPREARGPGNWCHGRRPALGNPGGLQHYRSGPRPPHRCEHRGWNSGRGSGNAYSPRASRGWRGHGSGRNWFA
jgi:1-deoxy-D-xylulose-5-phosphate synthase